MAEYAYKLRNKKSKQFYTSRKRTAKAGAIYNTPPQRRWPSDAGYKGGPEEWEIVKYMLVEVIPEEKIVKDGTEEHGQ